MDEINSSEVSKRLQRLAKLFRVQEGGKTFYNEASDVPIRVSERVDASFMVSFFTVYAKFLSFRLLLLSK